MGEDKASLPVGSESMVERVARILADATDPVVVVASPSQVLPRLPDEILIVRDTNPGRGPLQGLRDGLAALPEAASAAFVSGCDVPLLKPAFVEAMIERLGDYDIALPVDGGKLHPLAGVYRRTILPRIDALLAADQCRLTRLIQQCDTLEVDAETLRGVDPQLYSLLNCNRQEDFQAALRLLEDKAR